MASKSGAKFVVVGGGLGGPLMALLLGRAGHEVEVYEKREDPRARGRAEGRSINLAISTRGIDSLAEVGLARDVLARAIPMRGRMIHSMRGDLAFQPYGTDASQVINSISRSELNIALLNAAEKCPGVRLIFGRRCTGVDLDERAVTLADVRTGETTIVRGDVVVGADGAFSTVRQQMQRLDRFDYQQAYLEHGYKELTIPAAPDGRFALEKHALHIWPRGGFMMIALPNLDGSFTCTLFWPFTGPHGFDSLKTGDDVVKSFQATFPDAVPLMPGLADDYLRSPVGSLVTIRCSPWHHRGRAVLLGDACHAVVPFYGQGANAGFEDCLVLDACLRDHAPRWEEAFARYHTLRRRDTDALADLSLANFVEMRDHTASPAFLLGKRLEKGLHRLFPRLFVPLYTMVTFTRTPYAAAVERARRQALVVKTVAAGLFILAAVSILSILMRALP